MQLRAVNKISLMVVFPIIICCTIIIIICFNFLGSFLPVWITDTGSIQTSNQKTFFDYLSYFWGLKVASQYHKVLLGHSVTMDFYRLLRQNQAKIANQLFTPDIVNKIALSEDRVQKSSSNFSNAMSTEYGALLFSTWYHKDFTEANQFDVFPEAKINLLNYSVFMDPVLRPFFDSDFTDDIAFFKNEAVNITFDNDGFLYSYPAKIDTSFAVKNNNTANCTYGTGLMYSYDPRCSNTYNLIKNASSTLYIREPYRNKEGENLKQVICEKDEADPDNITAIICISFRLTGLNETYYEVLNRVQSSLAGYFFVTFPDTLDTLYYPNDTLETTLYPIWELELTGAVGDPSLADYKAIFNFSNLTTPNIQIITPLNTTNTQPGLTPDEINTNENIPYQHIGLTDGAELLVKPIMINTLNDDKTLLVKKPLYQTGFVASDEGTQESLSSFQEIMRELIILLIGFLIQIFLAITLYTVRFSSVVFRRMLQPIKNIVQDMEKLKTEEIENFDLLANVEKKSSLEIYNIRGVFQKLIQVMKAAQDAYSSGDDTLALLNFAQAKVLYHELGNMKGVGICESNIGTIHLKNHHYGEAIIAYKAAINISTNELNELNEMDDERDSEDSSQQNSSSASSEAPQQKILDINRERVVLANRMFNLANACVFESEHTKNQRLQSAIDTFQLVKRMDQSLNMNPHRIILISIELSKIYLSLGNIQKAEAALKEAEDNLLQRTFENLEIPRAILENKMKIQKALMYKENGNIYEATEILTTVLEEGEIYDPADRKKCLEELRNIFKENDLNPIEIDRLLAKFKIQNFEFLFLVDASYSMTGVKIQNAIATIKDIFVNFIGEDDKASYIFFNDTPHVVFHMTYKSINQVQLENYLGQIPETKGTSSLIRSIYLGLQEFKDNDFDSIPLNKKKKEELAKNRWIILITDGGGDPDDVAEESISKLHKLMQKLKCNIVVVGYTYNEKKISFLQKLSNATFQSQYIDIGRAENLDHFLKALVEETSDNLPALEIFQGIDKFSQK